MGLNSGLIGNVAWLRLSAWILKLCLAVVAGRGWCRDVDVWLAELLASWVVVVASSSLVVLVFILVYFLGVVQCVSSVQLNAAWRWVAWPKSEHPVMSVPSPSSSKSQIVRAKAVCARHIPMPSQKPVLMSCRGRCWLVDCLFLAAAAHCFSLSASVSAGWLGCVAVGLVVVMLRSVSRSELVSCLIGWTFALDLRGVSYEVFVGRVDRFANLCVSSSVRVVFPH